MDMETEDYLFISYASQDRNKVLSIVKVLEDQGIKVWLDQKEINGASNYAFDIVLAIEKCKMLVIMCSNTSLKSKNVKQEIQLAWKYEKAYLPLLLEAVEFPKQIQYWLEGTQWIQLFDLPTDIWLPKILKAIDHTQKRHMPSHRLGDYESLMSMARYTDKIWPVRAIGPMQLMQNHRGLGAVSSPKQYSYKIGEKLQMIIDSDRDGFLLLLDKGPENILYCLCPSWFAPEEMIKTGKNILPQEKAYYPYFDVTGIPGREHVLAIITNESLNLNWMPDSPNTPAKMITPKETDDLVRKLKALDPASWTAICSYFDIS